MGTNTADVFGEDDGQDGDGLREVELLDQAGPAAGEDLAADLADEDGWDLDDEFHDSAHVKWTADGAETLDEAAAMLEAFAAWLRGREADGWQLTQPVDGGWCFMERPRPDGGHLAG